MVYAQIDMSEELNKEVKLYAVKRDIKSREAAIINILENYLLNQGE